MRLKNRKHTLLIVVLGLLLFLLIPSYAQEFLIHFLPVGMGDAIFIQFPEGSSMLIDGGTVSAGDSVFKFVNEIGYNRIDYLVWTHCHDDHIGGLIPVLKQMEIGEIWACPYYEDSKIYHEFINSVNKKKIKQKTLSQGDESQIGEVKLKILHPPSGKSLQELGGINSASLVIRIQYGQTSVLLPADIDQNTDRKLVRIYGQNLKSTVLKVPHHGSPISNSEEFLTCVAPKIAVLSVGPSKYNYPSPETMARLSEIVPQVFRTDRDGEIVIVLDGKTASAEVK